MACYLRYYSLHSRDNCFQVLGSSHLSTVLDFTSATDLYGVPGFGCLGRPMMYLNIDFVWLTLYCVADEWDDTNMSRLVKCSSFVFCITYGCMHYEWISMTKCSCVVSEINRFNCYIVIAFLIVISLPQSVVNYPLTKLARNTVSMWDNMEYRTWRLQT